MTATITIEDIQQQIEVCTAAAENESIDLYELDAKYIDPLRRMMRQGVEAGLWRTDAQRIKLMEGLNQVILRRMEAVYGD
ncbi:MAG: hypothetical protein KOO60_07505 [Gemmatimonadales bacterium]|nr:hypothetical protein [Gemmatimonadales bacterium]